MAKKKYSNEQMLRKIYKLRTHGNLTWQQIADEIENDYGNKINPATIKSYYENYVARASVITNSLRDDKRRAKEVSIDWNKRLLEKFDLIDQTMNKQYARLNDMIDKAYNEGKDKKFISLLRSLLDVSKDLQNQIFLIKRQQEQIIVNQKNVIYSPLQIMTIMNKELDRVLEKEGLKLIDKDGKVKRKIFE